MESGQGPRAAAGPVRVTWPRQRSHIQNESTRVSVRKRVSVTSAVKMTQVMKMQRVRRVNTNVDHEVKSRYWRWLQSKEQKTR